ncbi:MAG TPA: hypothetical protein VJQ43_00275, partial [Thermoplasmata archaeon]|nr:hypothetical protein [Thermoplasmata archaeon]
NDTFAFTAGAWQALHPTRSPPGRLGATLADDPIDHELVLFGGERVVGGRTGVVALNDTWVWANGTWTQVASTSGGPPGRAQAGTAFDSIAGTVILFGGNGARSIFNDTWAFHAGRWTDVTNAHASPSPRWGLTLANDPADSGVLLFGGYCGTRPPGTYCDDTWTFSGSAWTNRSSTAAPPARYSAGMLENSASGQIVLFGGTGQICVTTANSTSCAAVMLNDTWVYSGGTWTNWTSTLGPAPQGAAGPTFVDDPTDGYEFLFDVPASGSYPGTGTWWSLAPISGAAGLAVSTPTATVNPVTVNATTQLSVTVTGGSPPYQIVWNGLPGGCTSQNATQMPCTPNATGTVSVAVTATDSHGTHGTGGSLAITVTASPTRKIGSVRIDPTTATVVTNASAVFTATAWDGSGQPLSGVSYDWSLSPGQFATLALVGVPSIVSGTSVSVVAGSSPGGVEVRVNATYSGTTLSAFANLTIKGVGTGTGTVHASTGAPLGFVAILAIAALIAVLAALGVWAWSRSRSRSPPPPSSEPPQP